MKPDIHIRPDGRKTYVYTIGQIDEYVHKNRDWSKVPRTVESVYKNIHYKPTHRIPK